MISYMTVENMNRSIISDIGVLSLLGGQTSEKDCALGKKTSRRVGMGTSDLLVCQGAGVPRCAGMVNAPSNDWPAFRAPGA